MKKTVSSKKSPFFYIVLLAVGLLLLFGCVFGLSCLRNRSSEKFENCGGNYEDANYENNRFFHYNNTGRLIPTDPIHVSQELVNSTLYDGKMESENGSAKKKSQ